MAYQLKEPYSSLYEEYLKFEKNRVSNQGYTSLYYRARFFFKWLEDETLMLEEMSISDAIKYKKILSEHKTKKGTFISTGTIINYLKTARSIFRYFMFTEKVKSNPFEIIKDPRLPDQISRNVLSESQMNRLLEKLSRFYEIENKRKALRRYRCHVLCELLYSTGLRISEACTLIQSNLDLENRFVYVPNGKGNKPRTAFLTMYATDVLKQYLEKGKRIVISSHNRNDTSLLFGAMTARIAAVLNKELKEICNELELPVITSHAFRHSLGTHLLKNGCDMRYIQVILGHECLGTTQVYTKVEKEDLKKSIDSFHPRQYKTFEKEYEE